MSRGFLQDFRCSGRAMVRQPAFSEEGTSPEKICARTIRALEERGVPRVYVSNLALPGAARVMREVAGRV